MIGMKGYLNAYIDRRMKYIIEEWELASRQDISDYADRLDALEQEIPRLKAFEKIAGDKLAQLENRAKNLKGRT